MGMAASQARLLELEARQSNLEYAGQQINQERSILSQQVTALYNSLLTMQVPTPPSTTDFSKIEYTGNDGASSFTIGNVKPNGNKTYVVDLTYKKVGHYVDGAGTVKVDTEKPEKASVSPLGRYIADKPCYALNDANAKSILGNDAYDGYIESLKNKFPKEYSECAGDGEAKDQEFLSKFAFYMTSAAGSSADAPHFMLRTDLETLRTDSNQEGYVQIYDYASNGTYTANETKDDCELTFDSSGRITEIRIPVYDDEKAENKKIVTYKTIPLEAAKTTDENAYKDAYAKYEYAQYQYDKMQQEINAKTEVIQQEDRNLELKLQRLDNERQQIKTEIEAVQNVLKENTERTYKTFSG